MLVRPNITAIFWPSLTAQTLFNRFRAASDGGCPMAEPDDDQAGLDAFAARMKSVGADLRPPSQGPSSGRRSTALGMAFRLSTELVVGVGVGGALGWALDRWLGTTPW